MNLERNSTGLPPLNHVLGGGLVTASIILLAAPPGVGKTSLTLQVLAGLGHQCLYASGEETREHVEGTARRVGALTPRVSVRSERNLKTIFAGARAMRARTIAIDSIQTLLCEDVDGRAGSLTQLRKCLSRLVLYARATDTTFWLIGHVTGGGDVAGPKTIEHDVDVVLKLSQGATLNGRERILRCPNKNRFGPTNAVGYFELSAKGFVPVQVQAREVGHPGR
jgi:DNA repair protein RadA/Sms